MKSKRLMVSKLEQQLKDWDKINNIIHLMKITYTLDEKEKQTQIQNQVRNYESKYGVGFDFNKHPR